MDFLYLTLNFLFAFLTPSLPRTKIFSPLALPPDSYRVRCVSSFRCLQGSYRMSQAAPLLSIGCLFSRLCVLKLQNQLTLVRFFPRFFHQQAPDAFRSQFVDRLHRQFAAGNKILRFFHHDAHFLQLQSA